MVHLDKDIVISEKESSGNELSKVNEFASNVLEKMKNENVAPTPYNFQIYFEASLDGASLELKNQISKLRQNETILDSEEQQMHMEKEIKESFAMVKTMVQSIGTVYKNVNLARTIIKKRNDELSNTTNQPAASSIIATLNSDMGKVDALLGNQLKTLKNSYEKAVSSLRSVEKEAVFDTRYELYNKKFLLNAIEKELQNINSNNYNSSLMILKIKNTLLSKITSNKDKIVLNKNIARLLQKTSKRSDIVAHLGDGVFTMLMKHTDKNSAQLACERISSLIYSANFFIGDKEIEMDLEMVACSLAGEKSVEENMANALKNLPNSSKDTQKFIMVQN